MELAQEINAGMPAYVARRTQDLLNERSRSVKGSTVLLLGVTYKADIADQRESPAVHVAQALAALGAKVAYHDPFVPTWQAGSAALECEPDLAAALADADVAILLQAHSSYDRDWLGRQPTSILDTRGVITGPSVTRL